MRLEHNDIEMEIDAALKTVGNTQPPAAMASRIHRSLETTMAASGQARGGWLSWVPASCAAVIAVLLLIFSQAHWMRGKQASAVETTKMVQDSAPFAFARPQPAPASERPHNRKMAMSQIHHRRKYSHDHHPANLLSYPLTQQEKLLLQFAQNAKPEDLRTLNPEYQAKVEAQQEAEFMAYLKSGTSSQKPRAADTNQSIQE